MKKLFITLFLAAPLLTGCANVDTMLSISDNNSASIVTSLAYKGSLADETDVNAVNIAANYEKFLDKDYNVETAYQDKLSTITASKSTKNLKLNDLDLSSLGFKTNFPDNRFIDIRKNFLITSYNIDCVYDVKEQKNKIEHASASADSDINPGLVPEYYHRYGDMSEMEPPVDREGDIAANLDADTMQFVKESIEDLNENKDEHNPLEFKSSFSIKVPSFASYNNADSIEGSVYTWNINQDEPTVIKLQYVRYSGAAIGIVLVLCIILLLLFARTIVRHDSQKRVDNNDNIV